MISDIYGRVLTSDDVLEMDTTELADIVGHGRFCYEPTPDEGRALEWIGRAYHVVDVLISCGGIEDRFMLISPRNVAIALLNDGVDRVPMLSDDTALQRIVWAIGPCSDHID
tara:strand:- start:303 stop:638 length:336 start_codon:yes stop_codon:yes gene_type:complete